jgi:DNA-binding MarR family transcriptional regulator/N-acetylglutamate synthase-like GNAT family acetyltransferase
MDLIQQLGALAFASRLKRLAERLHKDGSLIYKRQNLDFQARWFPVIYALSRHRRMAITELANDLNLTHPAINQIAGAMARKGLLISVKGKKDERRRFLSLSAKGRNLVKTLEPIWREIKLATDEVLNSSDKNFLAAVTRLEKSLDSESMFNRVIERLKNSQYEQIEIIDYDPTLKKHFKRLNYEWLKKYFKIEPFDKKILNDPENVVIKSGGFILFARLKGKIIGTVAMKKINSSVYELTKLAVKPEFRRQRAGLKLCRFAMDRARSAGAAMIVLATSPKLIAANKLYDDLGFGDRADDFGILENVKRKSIIKQLNLKKYEGSQSEKA